MKKFWLVLMVILLIFTATPLMPVQAETIQKIPAGATHASLEEGDVVYSVYGTLTSNSGIASQVWSGGLG